MERGRTLAGTLMLGWRDGHGIDVWKGGWDREGRMD